MEDMRNYRVIGAATYLDRTGGVQHIGINRAFEAPDAHTAPILALAAIDIHVGADANYDPAARWASQPTTEDETAKQEAIAASGLAAGSRVLHKSGGSAKRGADARVGVVQRVYAVSKGYGEFVVKASVDWPAPRRINGDGWHRSDVLTSALILATDEEIERRRELNRALVARRGY